MTVRLSFVTLKFYRVRSISNSSFVIDQITGLKYATTEQVIVDVKYTKSEYVELIWKNLLNRYGKQFVKNPGKYPKYIEEREIIDQSIFGV